MVLIIFYQTEQYDNFTRSSFTSTNNLVKTNNLNRGIFYYSGHGKTGGQGMALGYQTEQYDNFTRSSFTSTNNLVKTNNLNRGIFYYSGHGKTGGQGMALGGGSSITPSELRKMDMNNTKVAFFFACYCGLPDQTGDSMATAAVKAGAKASFAYKISSKVLGDRSVSKLIFTEMMNGETLNNAVSKAREIYQNYEPLKEKNVVIAGNKNTKISDTYTIKEYEELYVPEGYVYNGGNGRTVCSRRLCL